MKQTRMRNPKSGIQIYMPKRGKPAPGTRTLLPAAALCVVVFSLSYTAVTAPFLCRFLAGEQTGKGLSEFLHLLGLIGKRSFSERVQ